MSKTVLITGASGFIGSHLLRACIQKDWDVRAFVLPDDPETDRLEQMGAKIFTGDIRDTDAVRNAVERVNIVFHCAGLVTDWGTKQLFEGVMVTGTENVCRAAMDTGVDRLVHISTNDVFGRIEDRIIDESMPLKPWNEPYPDFKIQAEKTVWEYHEKGLSATMVYPCWVYGVDDKTFVPLLADAIIKGEMVFWRKGVLVWPTYIENLVELLLLIAESDRSNGQGYLVHDGTNTTLQEFSGRIAQVMGVKVPRLHIPYSLAWILSVIMEFIWTLFRFKSRPLLTTYAVKNLGSRFRYSIEKARRELDWEPKIPYENGMAKTMDWLKGLDRSKLKQK